MESRTCECGQRATRYSHFCRKCEKLIREEHLAEARRIVAAGKCPVCGRKLRRNNSMAGWWQCEQFGNEQFRVDPSQPSCTFQTFTE